jgi:type 2 lantibiotic biosynthesis protein LanM
MQIGGNVSDAARVARIAARAASLGERLAAPPDAAREPEPEAGAHLARWRAVVAAGDAARFAARLRWDGIAAERLPSLLAARPAPDPSDLPAWARLLDEVLRDAAHEWDGAPLDAARPEPFEEIVLPFARAAAARLRATDALRRAAGVVTGGALRDLERALLRQLSAVAAPALLAAFDVARGAARGAATRTPRARAVYDAFVDRMLRGGALGEFLEEHAALARLLCIRCLLWVDACAELLARLREDADDVAAALNGGAPLGRLTRVDADLSDPHEGGRTVCVLDFAAGSRVVYKPRSLMPERAFADLVAWLNDGRAALPLRPLAVVDRGTHGWMEFAAPAPCATAAEVERFHLRGGMLLCLAYVLGGEDFHSGNVLACGEHPVLIDMEVLLRPARPAGAGAIAGAIAGAAPRPVWRHVGESVLRTNLLPELHLLGDAGGYLEGGLAARVGAERALALGWVRVNTDAMALAPVSVPPSDRRNLPRLDGGGEGEVVAADPTRPVVRGFRHMYDVLRAHRDALLAPGGPLARLGGQPVRIVLRQTRLYHTLLRRTLEPRALRGGAARSIELDVLKRPTLGGGPRHPLWPVLADEHAALERLDVPAFRMRADAVALPTAHGEVPDYVPASGLACAVARLRALDDDDRERQAHCIRIAYASHRDRMTGAMTGAFPPLAAGADGGDAELTEGEARGEAARIARLLARLAVRAGDGSAGWYALAADPGPPGVRWLGPGLAAGTAGVALFLATLDMLDRLDARDARARAPGYRDLALAALRPALRAVRARGGAAPAEPDGLAFALAQVGRALDDASLLRAAERAARGEPPSRAATASARDAAGRCPWCWERPDPAGALPPAALRELDYLCCGSFRRVESLLAAGVALGRADLRARAGVLARRTVERGRRRGSYGGALDSAFTPALLGGIAGVGYELLRLHRPDRVPAIDPFGVA